MRLSRKVLIAALALALTGVTVGVGFAALRPGAADVATASEPPSPQPTRTIPPAPAPDPVVLPPVKPATPPSPGAPAYDVAAAQRRLNELHYYIGPADGKIGAAFRSAVMAVQKVHGLGADGAVGEQTLVALASPVTPALKGGPATRIEVDLSKQVLYLVEGGQLMRILPISSGSGQAYKQKSGATARSLTPVGWFKIERRIKGERKADLGILYDPMYFYRGWAIHGSNSVPAYPASHGCVRVTRADAIWLFNRVPNGMPVYLYGGVHTFTAGSSAPGTDNPAGDGGGAAPSESPAPTPTATSSPASPSPSPSPTGSEQPTEQPSGEPSETATPNPPLPTP